MARIVVVMSTILAVLAGSALPTAAAEIHEVSVDFSTAPQGLFPTDFFKQDGLTFTQGNFVGFVQGRPALIGPVAGKFTPWSSRVSVELAPAEQGTAEYTLTAIGASGEVVAAKSTTVTQDEGDPLTGPMGYFTLDLGNVASDVQYFTLNNRFIGSSFPQITRIEFGVAKVTFTTHRS
jgi:hypothetical protein